MNAIELLTKWNLLPSKAFARQSVLDQAQIVCDCSGLINLLFETLNIAHPYGLSRPKAVHYFAVLQEIGSGHISTIKPGHLVSWRKDVVPKSGDTGHVLVAASVAEPVSSNIYSLSVFDATKSCGGLSKRELHMHTNDKGQIVGVRLDLDESKVKRTPVYHAAIDGSRYCFGCALPKKVCLCGRIEAEKYSPAIIIFRHPDERGRTLSTVSLIKQRFPDVLVKEGEVFSEPRYEGLTLLFPGGQTLENTEPGNDQDKRTYLLIDATWRKAQKMLHLNEWMQNLPRRTLETGQLSNYLIRKVPDIGALSTVETFAYVAQERGLLALFKGFVDNQISVMGASRYHANYQDHINYDKKR